ncbi:hypothetical protein [Rossellomorea vietnamensis]|uniref:hypothetical protein n=1 Tax=Rossellomorea vietnamensis TaxID=218284 RepID=UPI001653B0CD|nr:hypothetical protein [Rossellomorea vietnamensis]
MNIENKDKIIEGLEETVKAQKSEIERLTKAEKEKYREGFEDGKQDMWASIYDPSYKKK